MIEWYNALDGLDKSFTVCALIGGFLFAIKFILMFIGADADVDFDLDTGDGDGGFLWFSTFSITAFFMMFGLGGLTCSRQFGLPGFIAFALAVTTGVLTMVILKVVMQKTMSLQSSGTLQVDSAIGTEGTVYLKIPAGGKGKVQLTIQGCMQVMDAVSDADTDLPTGTVVVVVSVINNILKVTKE